MTPTTIDAVYRDGVLHPAAPLPLADGTAVRLTVTESMPATPSPDPATVLARILATAAKAKPGPRENTSERVDEILYGKKGDPGDVR